jgi:hypothetical protein
MRDIYLIDFENVASEGLSGITYLTPEDEVIIFYSANSNRLSMKMHILIGKSVCKLRYFEVAVGGKNALDHQISTWVGYLVGTHAADRNYYIVSRDMGYKFVASFWTESEMKASVRCIENIRAAGRLERIRAAKEAKAETQIQPEIQAEIQPEPQPEIQEIPAIPEPVETAPVLQEPVEIQAETPEITPEPVQKPVAEVQPEIEAAPEIETAPEPEIAAAEEATPPEAELEPEEIPAPKAMEYPIISESLTEEPAEAAAPDQGRSKNYRSRQRYRRGRGKNSRTQDTAEEAAAPEPEKPEKVEKPEPIQAEKPEKSEKPEKKPKTERKRSARKLDHQERVDLTGLLAPYPGLQEQQLQQLIADNKRQVLCNTLRKQLGQEKGLALYNEIKKTAWH